MIKNLIIIGIGFFCVLELLGFFNCVRLSDIADLCRKIKRKILERFKLQEIITVKKDDDTTFLGFSPNSKIIRVPNNAKHIFVCGTTGSGKTVALSNFIKSGVAGSYPMLIIDGKGDVGSGSILETVKALKEWQGLYIINLNDPERSDKYNPFKNTTPSKIKDMLMSLTEWSEEHYKMNVDRYLSRVINLMHKAEMSITLKTIVCNMQTDNFLMLSANCEKRSIITKEENISNIDLVKISEKAVEGSFARFGAIIESEIGTIFDENGIDILTAIKERAIILFILNPLSYPEISALFGNLIMLDSRKAVSGLYESAINRTFFIFDEINVYATKSLINLVNKSRSANVTCILATQSLSDLDEAAGVHFKEQVIENCNNYIVMRQNSDINAEKFASIIGTRQTTDFTYQIKNDSGISSETGLGSMRMTREFIYHPDEIKNLRTGEAIFVSKDLGYKSKVNINKPI
jgi:type IV secretory pathway TraG/TraD family ATPase VirD4